MDEKQQEALRSNIEILEDEIVAVIDTFETDNGVQLSNLGFWKENNDGISSNHVQTSVIIQPQIAIQRLRKSLRTKAPKTEEPKNIK